MVSKDPNEVPPLPRPYKIDEDAPAPKPAPPAPPADAPQDQPRFEYGRVTLFLIAINALVYIAMLVDTHGQSWTEPTTTMLVHWGGNWGPLTLHSEWWRLLSSVFVHAGIAHIGWNMVILSYIGSIVERAYGSGKFIVLYLLAGLGGSICSVYFHPDVVSVGASGAILGCFGAFITLLRTHKAVIDPQWLAQTMRSTITLVIITLLSGLWTPRIDNTAHIGGFLTGVLAGACVVPKQLGDKNWTARNLAWTIFLLTMLAAAAYADSLNTGGVTH